MKRETISKTIRMPKRINEGIGEMAMENNISLNKCIICSCALAMELSKMGFLEMGYFTKLGDE